MINSQRGNVENISLIEEGKKTIINEEKKYRELKESIRTMNSERSDAEKVNLIIKK